MKEHRYITSHLVGFSYEERLDMILRDIADWRRLAREYLELSKNPKFSSEVRQELYKSAMVNQQQVKLAIEELKELKRRELDGEKTRVHSEGAERA